MKLAEALIERADLQQRLAQLEARLNANAKVQEGEKPAEDPDSLLKELDTISQQLEELIARINLTNASTVLDGRTLTDWIAHREVLGRKLNILRDFLNCASATVLRGRSTEIVIKSTVSVSELRNTVDAFSKEYRETDTKIQSANWTTDLI